MNEIAVLIGAHRDGEEITVPEPPPGTPRIIRVPDVPTMGALLSEATQPESTLRVVTYSCPWINGGWSRDDAGRLRYVAEQ